MELSDGLVKVLEGIARPPVKDAGDVSMNIDHRKAFPRRGMLGGHEHTLGLKVFQGEFGRRVLRGSDGLFRSDVAGCEQRGAPESPERFYEMFSLGTLHFKQPSCIIMPDCCLGPLVQLFGYLQACQG